MPARAVAFSPDGRLLATGDSSGTGILWDVADPTHPARVATLNHDAAIEALAFRPHASLLATACGGAVTVWDVTEPARPVPIITLHHLYRRRRHALRAVAFSPDGRLLACGGGAGTTLWDLTDPAQPTRAADLRRRRWRSTVRAVGFSPDGRLLVTGHGQAGTRAAVLWDVSNPAQPTRAAAFQPQPARTFANHRPTVHAVAFVPDRRLLATASGAVVRTDHEFRVRPEERDSAVTLWDLTDPARPVRSVTLTQRSGSTLALSERRIGVRAGALTGHTAAVRALAVSADGRQLATGGDDSTVLLWDLTDPAHPRHTLTLRHVDAVHAVGFSPDGRLLASGSRYGDPGLWRTT
ncbi:MAG: WD40 repeat domain-containing protein [Actinobacteria bacterium]|nr:WD40 repeat domain-containing protein [Actinomycetota bacterium]